MVWDDDGYPARQPRCSGSGRRRLRRRAGALACVLVGGAAASARRRAAPRRWARRRGARQAPPRPRDSQPNALESLIAALGAARAEKAVDAIGHGLVLMEAQKRIDATERKLAREAAASRTGTDPRRRRRSPGPLRNGARLGRHQRHHGPPPGGGQALRPHPRRADGSTAILLSGIALAPPDAPEAVQKVINNANTIVGRPYVWGGGHASFYSYGYDCSGSVSYALFGGGLIPEPLTSGSLEGWGEPGPGKWITVYANADHTFMEIAGLRWDTVGDARGTGPRWHLDADRHRRLRRPPPAGPLAPSRHGDPSRRCTSPGQGRVNRTGGSAVGERLDRDAVVGLPHAQLVGGAAGQGRARGPAGRGARPSARGRRPSS